MEHDTTAIIQTNSTYLYLGNPEYTAITHSGYYTGGIGLSAPAPGQVIESTVSLTRTGLSVSGSGNQVTVSSWSPSSTSIGSTAAAWNATGSGTVYFNLTGLTPQAYYNVKVDGKDQFALQADLSGVIRFAWSSWSSHAFVLYIPQPSGGGGGGGGGGIPPPLPTFTTTLTYSVPFSLFGGGPPVGTVHFFAGQIIPLPPNPPVTYHWDFGDGSTSNLQDPVHQYNVTMSGTFHVTLTECDSSKNCATSSADVTVTNWSVLASFIVLMVMVLATVEVAIRIRKHWR